MKMINVQRILYESELESRYKIQTDPSGYRIGKNSDANRTIRHNLLHFICGWILSF